MEVRESFTVDYLKLTLAGVLGTGAIAQLQLQSFQECSCGELGSSDGAPLRKNTDRKKTSPKIDVKFAA